MKRLASVVLCLALSAPLMAQEAWKTNYEKGVAAAARHDWNATADAMQKAIGGKSDEDAQARVGRDALPYLPWYWLGISLLNSGDTAGAIDALRKSESQGAVQKTTYFASLREALTVAQAQKGRSLKDVQDAKKADEAIGRALTKQIEAAAAGAQSEEKARIAALRLRTAFEAKKVGTPAAVQQATQAANEAAELFAAATQEARLKRQRATVPPPTQAAEAPAAPKRNDPPVAVAPIEKQQPSPPLVPARGKETDGTATKPATKPATTTPPPVAPTPQPRSFPPALTVAFRHFTDGRFGDAERMTLQYVGSNPRSADAHMLLGSARYMRGVLENDPSLIEKAGEDFRTALRFRPESTIDRRYFSPKLVNYFRTIQNEQNR